MTQVSNKNLALSKLVGNNMRILRCNKAWLIKDLSHRLDLSIPAVSKMEAGRIDIPLSRIKQIAFVFEIPIRQLFETDILNEINSNFEIVRLAEKKVQETERTIEDLRSKLIKLYSEIDEKY